MLGVDPDRCSFGGKRPHVGDRYETTASGLEDLVLQGTRAPWVCEGQDEERPRLFLSKTAQMGEGRAFSRSLRGEGSQRKLRRLDTQKEKDKALQKETMKCVLKPPPALVCK